jgi:DNA-binding response OmpR family regulator
MPRDKVILLAEDHVMLRNLIRLFLSGKGYEVLAAADGNEAVILAHARQGPIDLLLTDVEMPLLVGVAAYRKIKLERPEIRVLFLSGGVLESSLPEPWPFLGKPFQLETLVARVKSVLSGSVDSSREVILIVDQNLDRRRRTKSILTDNGFGVLVATSIKEADTLAARTRIDLIISEVMFDVDNGVRLAEREAANRNIETLLISHCNPAVLYQVPGFSKQAEFLHNPFTPEELLTRVRKLLKG